MGCQNCRIGSRRAARDIAQLLRERGFDAHVVELTDGQLRAGYAIAVFEPTGPGHCVILTAEEAVYRLL